MRRNSDGTGSSRRLRWPGTSGLRWDVPDVQLEVLGWRDGAIAMPDGRRDRTVHIRAQLVHGRDSSVDEVGTPVRGERAINPRLAPARSQCGAPEAEAVLTQRAELAYRQSRRAGERRA